jgi:hypothetical protein
MKPWCLWLIKNHLGWLLKAIIVMSYPVHLLAYCEEAWDDISYVLREVYYEKEYIQKGS